MTFLLSSILALLLLLDLTPFSKGNDYLYTDDEKLDKSQRGGVRVVDPEDDKDVWPIMDYVKPKQKSLETDEHYKERILNPAFLTDQYDKPRVVEFYAPWCGHCIHFKPQYIQVGKITKEFNPNMDFFAISCVAHSEICKINEVRGYPTLKFFVEYNNTGIKIEQRNLSAKELDERFYQKYSSLSKSDNEEVEEEEKSASMDNEVHKQEEQLDSLRSKMKGFDSHNQHPIYHEDQNDVYTNAASSLHYALRSSIFMTTHELSIKQKNTLREWLTLLSQTLPRNADHSAVKDSLNHVDSLLSNIDYVSQGEDQLLKILMNGNKDQQEQWTISCSKGVQTAGYTCGLWQLLHIVTIGFAHANIDAGSTLSPMASADTIRDYIEEYFTCDECRLNFIKMYEECRFDRCNRLSKNIGSIDDRKQLPLWLWEVHNDVNVRLLREERISNGNLGQLTSGEEQSARWPSSTDCPSCWHEGGGWDEDSVYQFLDSFYWPSAKVKVIKQASEFRENNFTSGSYYLSLIGTAMLFGLIYLRKLRRPKNIKNL